MNSRWDENKEEIEEMASTKNIEKDQDRNNRKRKRRKEVTLLNRETLLKIEEMSLASGIKNFIITIDQKFLISQIYLYKLVIIISSIQ